MFNSISKLDRRLIVICAICIGAVSYLLLHPELLNGQGQNEKDNIGQVTKVKSDIRRKSKQDYFWQPTYVNSYVSRNDTIYTGSKSSAEIQLNDGKLIKVSENSLVRFSSVNKNISIDLAFGQLAATGVNKTFTITDCGKQYTIDAAQASFEITKKKDCGNFDLNVSKGTVSVNKKAVTKAAPKRIETKSILEETHEEKKTLIAQPTKAAPKVVVEIKPTESFLISPATVVAEPVVVAPPVVEEKIVLENPKFITKSKKTVFDDQVVEHVAWKPVPQANYYNLEIADNAAFKDAVSNKVIDTQFEFKAPQGGTYFFQVKAVTDKGVESLPSDPINVALTYPSIKLKDKVLSATYNARTSKDVGPKKNFNVAWAPVAAAEKYVVEYDNDPKFSKPTKLTTREPSSVIPVQTGDFHYRVSAFDKTGRKISSTSAPGEINYKKIFNMAQPLIESTLKNMSYYFQKDFAQFIWLKWNSSTVDDKNSYRLEISKTASFTQISSAYKVKDTKFLIRNKLDGGEYYWRVRSESDTQFSDWSDLGRFKITTKN